MKKLLLATLLLLVNAGVFASHIIGGEMVYEYLGPGAAAGTKKYRITLVLFRDNHCTNCAVMPPDVWIAVFDNATKVPVGGIDRFSKVPKSGGEEAVLIDQPPCIVNPPHLDYARAFYTIEVDLEDNDAGYMAAFQTCCRVTPLQNVRNAPGTTDGTGSTYSCNIPGRTQLGATGTNRSPQFSNKVATLCQNRKFSLDFSATDADGDRLEYSLTPAFDGGAVRDAGSVDPAPPPYGNVEYLNGYSGTKPLGNSAAINPQTGIISGIAPEAGNYVVSVNINEYRGTQLISTHRKDFIITVSGCDLAGAELESAYITCEGFSYTFKNLNQSPLNKTYFWDFGDGTTSTEESPTHQYRDTGVYNIRLMVNDDGECGESTTSELGVFSGFNPAFALTECENNPTRFQDKTTTAYGTVNSWFWDFGESSGADTSHARNPAYTYPTPGEKSVSLTATNTKGCVATVTQTIVIQGAAFAGRDTTIVAGQSLQFEASAGSRFLWSPATDLNDPTSRTPVGTYNGAYDSIRYKVVIFNEPNCVDSAYVTVRIYKTGPQIFVPTAFTPNGDGRNDIFLPVSAGISKFEYFRVYNRWGQEVFATTTPGEGWDGRIKGQQQSTGVFVWLVRGTDFQGRVFAAKGTVTLIR